jgi:hypothetical protein
VPILGCRPVHCFGRFFGDILGIFGNARLGHGSIAENMHTNPACSPRFARICFTRSSFRKFRLGMNSIWMPASAAICSAFSRIRFRNGSANLRVVEGCESSSQTETTSFPLQRAVDALAGGRGGQGRESFGYPRGRIPGTLGGRTAVGRGRCPGQGSRRSMRFPRPELELRALTIPPVDPTPEAGARTNSPRFIPARSSPPSVAPRPRVGR